MSLVALDLFAGTGWGVACQRLGIEEYGVEIMDEAVQTREAAGMTTIYRDVWDGLDEGKVLGNVRDILNTYQLLIASPPCQTFSVAGKGAGRKALDDVLGAITFGAYKTPETLRAATEGLDDRTALVLTPLTYAYRDRPTYIVLEQVPTVLPVWEACAEVLRGIGYSVVTGVLNAEQYGVPQTRKRAILFARKDGVEAAMPTPTHSQYHPHRPTRFDEGVQPWVSMSEALGIEGGALRGNQRPARASGAYQEREVSTPAQTITSNARSYGFLRSNYGTGGDASKRGERVANAPAPTLTSKADRNKWEGVRGMTTEEAALLQTYPANFPFAGSNTKRFLQIGNAVPPLLGEVILRPVVSAYEWQRWGVAA